MENWAEIRRRVLADGLSGRAACREYNIHWKTPRKILDNAEPPGYRRTKPKRPSILDPLLPVVHQILEDDRKAPKKQRHTGKRIFDRLRAYVMRFPRSVATPRDWLERDLVLGLVDVGGDPGDWRPDIPRAPVQWGAGSGRGAGAAGTPPSPGFALWSRRRFC